MNKLIGSILIIISTLFIGYEPLYRKNKRTRILFDFIQDLQYLHSELQTNLSSIPELVDLLYKKNSPNTHKIYDAIQNRLTQNGIAYFYDSWKEEIEHYELWLTSDEMNQLLFLGNMIGKFTLEEQLNIINHTITLLRNSHKESKAELREKQRIYLGLGSSLGIILVILLI